MAGANGCAGKPTIQKLGLLVVGRVGVLRIARKSDSIKRVRALENIVSLVYLSREQTGMLNQLELFVLDVNHIRIRKCLPVYLPSSPGP
jgi:hypothetical protein